MPSGEKNRKFLVPLADGIAVEAVWYGSGTLCISSQAGCAVGCPFCASGSAGLRRHLSADELMGQVAVARGQGLAPKRITVSGTGEPLHNPQAVSLFIEICRPQGLPVSVTTTGGSEQALRHFLQLPHNGLMLSLHAGTAGTHRRLVPRAPEFEALWGVLEETLPVLARRRRRKIGINYLLLSGWNDSAEEISALARRMRRFPDLTLHLLTCNPVPGSPFTSPRSAQVDAVHGFLSAGGINVRRPNRWRISAEGGCGTLLARSAGPEMRPFSTDMFQGAGSPAPNDFREGER